MYHEENGSYLLEIDDPLKRPLNIFRRATSLRKTHCRKRMTRISDRYALKFTSDGQPIDGGFKSTCARIKIIETAKIERSESDAGAFIAL